MVHVHTIKINIHIVLGTPPLLLVIASIPFLLCIYAPGFNVGNPLNITIFEITYFSVSDGMSSDSYSSLYCFKDTSFVVSDIDIIVVREIILSSLGCLFVSSFSATMLFYLSVSIWISYGYGTSVPMTQSNLVLLMELSKVKFGHNKIYLKR